MDPGTFSRNRIRLPDSVAVFPDSCGPMDDPSGRNRLLHPRNSDRIVIVLRFSLATGSIWFRILIGLIMVALACLCFYTLWSDDRRKEVFICGRMIKIAAEVLESNYWLVLWIPLFIVLIVVLLILVGFEILAAWSVGSLTFYPEYPFYGVSGFFSNILTILIFFEFYWGMSFLKQACIL